MQDACDDFWLGGVARRVYSNVCSDTGVLEDTKKDIGGSSTGGLKTEGSNRTLEAGRLDGSKTYKGNCSGAFPQPGGPGGRRITINTNIEVPVAQVF